MMGPTHAAGGLAAGLALATWADTDLPTAVALGGICAGAALLPDMDHPSGTLARMYGPVTKLASTLVNRLSSAVVTATGGGRRIGGHRTATHFPLLAVPAAIATGTAAAAAADAGDDRGLWAVLFLMMSLALAGLMTEKTRALGFLGTAAAAAGLSWATVHSAPMSLTSALLTAAMGIGVAVHLLGDALTKQGIPWFGPLKVGGKRWKNIAVLGPMSIRTNSWADYAVGSACIVASGYLLLGFLGFTF